MRNWSAIGIASTDHQAQIRHLITVASAHALWARTRGSYGYGRANAAADYYDCLAALADARRIYSWYGPSVSPI